MRGECWHDIEEPTNISNDGLEWGRCKLCNIDVPFFDGFNPDYEHNANAYMVLFQELPMAKIRININTLWTVGYFKMGIGDKEFTENEIGIAICPAWLEAFKCKECVDGFVFDNGGSGICNVPCPKCNGTGSIFKKEGG